MVNIQVYAHYIAIGCGELALMPNTCPFFAVNRHKGVARIVYLDLDNMLFAHNPAPSLTACMRSAEYSGYETTARIPSY